eukprot:TRINITY_DN344_c0_g1_i2.p1 TRINITY_DN344_c0_g1~~TRINITY_DN344_c0_g1_i2.p1  ORF type:complete len:220 (+),score=102.13 TRINITY_DN344_c0_g1_i2:42-662(+)
MNSNIQTTTAPGTVLPTFTNERAAYAVYDKPADRRIRPWLISGGLVTAAIGATMIVFSLIGRNLLSNMWGVFAAGIALGAIGILNFITGWTLRPGMAAFNFWTSLILWGCAIAVLIVNGAMLKGYVNDQCGGKNASLNCQDIRQWHALVFTATGIATALFTPIIVTLAGYFWRTTRLNRQLPYGASATKNEIPMAPVANPVGSAGF